LLLRRRSGVSDARFFLAAGTLFLLLLLLLLPLLRLVLLVLPS
jgi:hypothetical protein